ncbi:MAG: hypothetical protein NZZ41_00120 [Candidatus Dojkabacteria bacterium]|nr:hypothetical protein [Candidatus Dojkabacteria bacterium]
MFLLGLVGKKNSGKDTLGNYLEKKYNFTKLSFAEPLKKITSILFEWEMNLLEGNTPKSRIWREQKDEYWSSKLKQDFTPRKALQTIGTDIFRKNFDENIWIYIIEKKILKNINDKNQHIVITDCRFENECKFIKEYGGILFFISRKESFLNDEHDSENIEKLKSLCDEKINNDSTLENYLKISEEKVLKYISINSMKKSS